jgi:hypothetical protein
MRQGLVVESYISIASQYLYPSADFFIGRRVFTLVKKSSPSCPEIPEGIKVV